MNYFNNIDFLSLNLGGLPLKNKNSFLQFFRFGKYKNSINEQWAITLTRDLRHAQIGLAGFI